MNLARSTALKCVALRATLAARPGSASESATWRIAPADTRDASCRANALAAARFATSAKPSDTVRDGESRALARTSEPHPINSASAIEMGRKKGVARGASCLVDG